MLHRRAQGGVVFGGWRFGQRMRALHPYAVCAALGGVILRRDGLRARHLCEKSRNDSYSYGYISFPVLGPLPLGLVW